MNGFEEKYCSRRLEFEMLVKKYDRLCLEKSGDFKNYFELIVQKYNVGHEDRCLEDGSMLAPRTIPGEEIVEIEIIQVGEYKGFDKNAYKFYFCEWHTIITDGKLTDDYKLNDEEFVYEDPMPTKLNHIERYISGFININEALNVKNDLIANNKFLINYLNEMSKEKD